MAATEERKERVILAGVHSGRGDALSDTTEETIAELEELVKTAGGEAVMSVIQNKSDIFFAKMSKISVVRSITFLFSNAAEIFKV